MLNLEREPKVELNCDLSEKKSSVAFHAIVNNICQHMLKNKLFYTFNSTALCNKHQKIKMI